MTTFILAVSILCLSWLSYRIGRSHAHFEAIRNIDQPRLIMTKYGAFKAISSNQWSRSWWIIEHGPGSEND